MRIFTNIVDNFKMLFKIPAPTVWGIMQAHFIQRPAQRTNDEATKEAITGPVYMDLFINLR